MFEREVLINFQCLLKWPVCSFSYLNKFEHRVGNFSDSIIWLQLTVSFTFCFCHSNYSHCYLQLKTAKKLKNRKANKMGKNGDDWNGLRLDKFKKRRPDFFIPNCMKVSFVMLRNQYRSFCGCDFANNRLLLYQFTV